MKSANSNLVFNLAGGGIVVFVIGYMLLSFFTSPAVPACSERFSSGIRLGFSDGRGNLLSPVDLEARFSGRKWGLDRNAAAISVANQPFDNALQVKLANAEDGDGGESRSGVSFIWRPRELAGASAACLSYAVFIPSTFKFPESGLLPGLFGATDLDELDAVKPEDSFVARFAWQPSGDVGVDVRRPGTGGYVEGASRKMVWPTGRWVPVEQEVRLNSRGAADGVLRTWIDGRLMLDRTGMRLREIPSGGISGVVADIGYARTEGPAIALRVSPLVVRWQ